MTLDWHLITVGLESYSAEPSWNLEAFSQCRRSVVQALIRHGASVEDWTSRATNGEKDAFLEALANRTSIPLVVYWTGHGEHSDDGYLAALADSTDPLKARNALSGGQIFEAVRDQMRLRQAAGNADHWMLLILDTCGSGAGASLLWSDLRREFRADLWNVGVVATTGDGAAFAGGFPRDLERVLSGFTSNDVDGIRVKELLRRLDDMWDGTPGAVIEHQFSLGAVLPLPPGLDRPVQAPVDTYAELREVLDKTLPMIRNHFYAKAQGSEIGEPAWHFTGRVAERRQITHWLQGSSEGMLVVSGVAGSGKSALLGMLLASSDPGVRAALQSAGHEEIARDLRPEDQAFDAVVHLSGRTIAEAVSLLASGLKLSDTRGDPDRLIDRLTPKLTTVQAAIAADTDRGSSESNIDIRRLTVLVDALDEARDPLPIAVLLRRMARVEGIRLLVGTRQSLDEGPDRPLPLDRFLLDALEATQVVLLELDSDAVYRYSLDRLRSKLPPDFQQHSGKLASVIAKYGQPFLFARLAVHEVLADLSWCSPGIALNDLLGAGHTGIFAHTIGRLLREDERVEALLHSLTYARGNGFPRSDGIWAIAASAILGGEVSDLDVEKALSVAAPYILQDTENGQTVYRLAHRTFSEWYHRADLDGSAMQ